MQQPHNNQTTSVIDKIFFYIFLWFPLKFDLISVTGMLQAYNVPAKHAIAL